MNRRRNKKTRTLSMPSKFADMTERDMEYRGGDIGGVIAGLVSAAPFGITAVSCGFIAAETLECDVDYRVPAFIGISALAATLGAMSIICIGYGISSIDAVQNWWSRKTNWYKYAYEQIVMIPNGGLNL